MMARIKRTREEKSNDGSLKGRHNSSSSLYKRANTQASRTPTSAQVRGTRSGKPISHQTAMDHIPDGEKKDAHFSGALDDTSESEKLKNEKDIVMVAVLQDVSLSIIESHGDGSCVSMLFQKSCCLVILMELNQSRLLICVSGKKLSIGCGLIRSTGNTSLILTLIKLPKID